MHVTVAFHYGIIHSVFARFDGEMGSPTDRSLVKRGLIIRLEI